MKFITAKMDSAYPNNYIELSSGKQINDIFHDNSCPQGSIFVKPTQARPDRFPKTCQAWEIRGFI
jgi:hypothetical protein